MEPCKVYWWRKVPNFGDFLTQTLLNHYEIKHQWVPVAEANLIITGSILEHLPNKWTGTIVGAGKLYEDSVLELSKAKILAVRGPLTAKGLPGDFALGDPGLLASLLVAARPVNYDLGVVPHWSDTELTKRFAYGRTIDPHNGPIHVITEIARCRRVVSSSLHGIIVADSFGIPRQAELPARSVIEGGTFKYNDYAASINMKPEFGKMVLADASKVLIRQIEIEEALMQFIKDLK